MLESWQTFLMLFMLTSWITYREFIKRHSDKKNKSRIEKENRRDSEFNNISVTEINNNHKKYMERIETEFQELLKNINESEVEINSLRREKWQSDLQTRAWRHACRDAQQMVWALQRQGCAAGSELTYFKPIEAVNILSNDINQ